MRIKLTKLWSLLVIQHENGKQQTSKSIEISKPLLLECLDHSGESSDAPENPSRRVYNHTLCCRCSPTLFNQVFSSSSDLCVSIVYYKLVRFVRFLRFARVFERAVVHVPKRK